MRQAVAGLVLALALLAAACGGDSAERPAGRSITLWITENQPERVRATRENVADFARRTGIRVRLVTLGDDELAGKVAGARRTKTLPDVMQVGMADAHAYVRDGVLDPDAAQQTVNELGEETFSARALSLLTSEGRVAAVPSDGWGQLLIYRRDLFAAAGLGVPVTLADVERAARRLNRDGRAGITLATTAGDGFTAETFEHVALASGCQLVDDEGTVSLTSPGCRDAFARYVRLARRYSPGGRQDVERTRDVYFAGRAAMVFWSPFLLDAMAGLRDEAVPTCPQCRRDPAYLARNSGLVGPLIGPDGEPAQYGTLGTWGITAGDDVASAQRLVKYLMSDGYLRWLALSPQGKYPVRTGVPGDVERYVRGWAALESGVERRAPLRRFYSTASIDSLGEGARSFRRWAFEVGEASLLGALSERQPITRALAAAIAGDITPEEAARRSQQAVERLRGPG